MAGTALRIVRLGLLSGTLVALLGTASAVAATQTAMVAADAYVDSAQPSTNYGSATALRADASPVRRVYLRFNVANTAGQVTKATLRVSSKSSSRGGLAVWGVADTGWGESKITWSSAPALPPASTRSTGAFSSGWVSIDVTPLVTGNGTLNFAVTNPSTTAVALRSREAGAMTAPQLVVETQPVVPPPPSAPVNTSVPTISGTAQAGQTLAADPGVWSGTQPISFSYAWRRCDASGAGCGTIAGATAQTYALTQADVASTLQVVVTGTNSAGASSATSAATGTVAATPAVPPANGSLPTITGTAQAGQTLAADPGVWSGTQPISFSYAWRRCDASGAGCGTIAGATAQTYALTQADVASTLRVVVTGTNSAGASSATSAATGTVTAAPSPGGDPVIAAAGDIACNSAWTTSGASCHYGATAATVTADPAVTDVLTLGDIQYECGDYSSLLKFYDPTWGLFRSRTHPAIGNHEYQTAPGTSACDPVSTTPAKGYFDYWNGIDVGSGPAGDRAKGYYSYDVGSWHLIALNSNCPIVGGCGSGSAQEMWLRNDLAAHPAACTLAYWHHPLFSSGEHGNNPNVRPLWDALYQAGAEIVLNGHDHDYERFAPQTPGAVVDADFGIREFVVGTGGKNHYAFTAAAQPNSVVRNGDTFGILKLTLHAQGYDWQFAPESAGSFTDAGSGSCHPSNADTTPPSIPANLTATAPSTGGVNLAWTASSDNQAVAGYTILRGGVKIGTSATTSYADPTAFGGTTYSYSVAAYDLAGNTSSPSGSVTVTTPGALLRLTAAADAKVDSTLPSTNFATAALRVDGSPDIGSYLKFDASLLSGTVRTATLRLWASSAHSVGFDVYAVGDSSWMETSLTYANQPTSSVSPTRLGASGPVTAGSWASVDVTSLMTAPGMLSVLLRTTSSTALGLASREDATHPPELLLTTG